MTEFLAALFAFLGAGVGSGLAFWTSRSQTSVEREARRREEWGRRFTTALDRATSPDPAARRAGRALLRALLASELATADDRLEAQRVLDAIATGDGGRDLRLLLPSGNLDDVAIVRDTGSEDSGGDSG